MKITILIVSLGLTAIGFTACGQPAGNTAMNHNGMMMNGNKAMNQNAMPTNHNTSAIHHNEMESSPNAASQAYDLQFIDTMSAHHQGAIEMAGVAVSKSTNPDLKAFAQKIIDDQKKEIAEMKDWREKWYSGKPAAKNMEMPGMGDSMKLMMGDGMKKLEQASGKQFDLLFLEMMTPHHAGATVMAKDALAKAEHPEIKTLANNIIKAQEAEIKQMANWKASWSK